MADDTIEGQEVTRIRTMGSQYDGGKFIEVYVGKKEYRMDVNEFFKILDVATFNVRKKRKYEHLTIDGGRIRTLSVRNTRRRNNTINDVNMPTSLR